MPTTYDGIIKDQGGAVHNVTSSAYNADPTGATDSTTAIQNAWNEARSSGGCVYLPIGTYKIVPPKVTEADVYSDITLTYSVQDGSRLNGPTTFIAKFEHSARIRISGSTASPTNNGVHRVTGVATDLTYLQLEGTVTAETPTEENRLTFEGLKPALHLKPNTADKEKQPRLEGGGRGATLRFDVADIATGDQALFGREQTIVLLDNEGLTDNERGIVVENLRIVNAAAADASSKTITSISGSGTTVTVTTSAAHGLLAGYFAWISGTTAFNGYHRVASVTSSTTFTFASTTTGTESAGTVADTFLNPRDYQGVGLRVAALWTGYIRNFQVMGFYAGIRWTGAYGSTLQDGEIRNCNVGLWLSGTPNGNTFSTILLQRIRPAATLDGITLPADIFPADAALAIGRRYGAAVLLSGGTITGEQFIGVNAEACGTAGYLFGSAPHSVTVVNPRLESIVAPIYAPGPIGSDRSHSVSIVSPSIDCDSLLQPAIYLGNVHAYTIVGPNFYQRGEGPSEETLAIRLTANAASCRVVNPNEFSPATGTDPLEDSVQDLGENNWVDWGDFSAASDGHVLTLPLFVKDGVTDTGAGQVMYLAGGGTRTVVPPFRGGSVLGIAVRSSAAPANAGLQFILTKNGANWSPGPSVTIPVGSATAQAAFDKGEHAYDDDDQLGFKVTPLTGFGSQVVAVEGVVYVEV